MLIKIAIIVTATLFVQKNLADAGYNLRNKKTRIQTLVIVILTALVVSYFTAKCV